MFPDRTGEIEFHRTNARRFAQQGKFPEARASYLKWVESLRQQNRNGVVETELREAQREYSEFVKRDPLYSRVSESVFQVLQKKPGILQTEFYKELSGISKVDLSYALYFAAEHGKIVRTKKGRTYALRMADQIVELTPDQEVQK